MQVILVGHSSGGACLSYALEHFPEKISKAIFLCATMVSNGQRPFDVFAEEVFVLWCSANKINKMFRLVKQISGFGINLIVSNS